MTVEQHALHIFFDDVVNYVIAETKEEARALLIEYEKTPPGDLEHVLPAEKWSQWPEGKLFNLRSDESGKSEPGMKTEAELIVTYGRGFFASTEY